jgi:hypothetical protein
MALRSCLGAIRSTSVIGFCLLSSLAGAWVLDNPTSPRKQPNPIVFANESSPPCPLPIWYARDLSWHNSSHHLDCSPAPHSRNDSVPTPPINSLCFTGLSRQPEGYGPPDMFFVNISSIGPCRQSNPGTVPPRKIGNGFIRCGSSAPTLFFHGSSDKANSTALVRVQQQFACANGTGVGGRPKMDIYTAYGEKHFSLICGHDALFNATCVSEPKEFDIPVKGWRLGFRTRIVTSLSDRLEP